MNKRGKLSNLFSVALHFIPENAPREPDPLQTAAPAECSSRAPIVLVGSSKLRKRGHGNVAAGTRYDADEVVGDHFCHCWTAASSGLFAGAPLVGPRFLDVFVSELLQSSPSSYGRLTPIHQRDESHVLT